MLRVFLVSWGVLAAAFAIVAWLLPGVTISGGVTGYLTVSLVFGVINAFVGTLLRMLALPVLINAVLLAITDSLSGDLTIDSFWWTAIWAAIVLSLATVLLQQIARRLLPLQA